MTNNRKINFKFQMSITEEHLGLTRVFNELAQIEDENKQLSPTDLHALKRRYMLRLLHNYSANTLHDATAVRGETLVVQKGSQELPKQDVGRSTGTPVVATKVSQAEAPIKPQSNLDINKSLSKGLGDDVQFS